MHPFGPASGGGSTQLIPLQPGAGEFPHAQCVPMQLAGPDGSLPQHCAMLFPKQAGRVPTQPADESTPASGRVQPVPLQPGATALSHIH